MSGGGTVFTEEKKIVRMCLSCLSVQRPDRGSSVFEGGHYFLNFKGCVQCGAIQQLEIRHREVDETEPDDPEFEETIHFNRQHTQFYNF